MPFSGIADLPAWLKENLSTPAQEVFLEAFNSAVEAENLDTSKGQAWRRAWETLKERGFVKGEMSGKWVKQAQEKVNNVVKLSENIPNEIQILRTGKWDHPQYGEIDITEHDLDLFIKSFKERARRIDLAIDQAHNPDEGAAGWFKDLFKKESDGDVGLYARVEWTDFGEELLEGKRFKYISPEFRFNYEDDETGRSYENVLYGAGLTNRPFIKEMEPIMMSEDVLNDFITENTMIQWKKKQDTMEFQDYEAIAELPELEDFSVEDIRDLFRELADSGNLPSGWTNEEVAVIYDYWNEEFDQCTEFLDGEVEDPGEVCTNIRARYFEVVEASEKNKKGKKGRVKIMPMKLKEVQDFMQFQDTMSGVSEEELMEVIKSLRAIEDFALDEGEINEVVGGIRDSMDLVLQMFRKLEFDEEDEASGVIEFIESLQEKAEKFDEKEKEAEELADKKIELEERVSDMEIALREQSWEQVKNKAMSEGRMTAKQAEFFKDRYMEDPEDTKEIIDNLEPIVEMDEKGSQKTIQDGQEAVRRLRSKVQEVKSEEGMSYSEAYKKVAQDNPDLYQQAKAERRSS